MKKIIIALALLISLPSFASATLMGFGDGNMYDPVTGEWQCLFLMDGNCYDKDQNILDTRPAGYTPPVVSVPQSTPETVYVPIYVQPNTVAGNTDTSYNSGNTTNSQTMPDFTPFAGAPYVIGTYDNWNPERTINNKYVAVGIDLVREEKLENSKYKISCITPSQSEVVLDTAPGLNNPKGYTQRIFADSNLRAYGIGTYTCKFVFTLPEGTFESETIEFTLE